MILHRLLMLKPMRPGVTGYARVQSERGQTLLQVHARGLRVAGVHVFWYAGDGEAVKLGTARVNPRSEASLTADAPGLAPERLHALIVLSDEPEPAPLLIGLYAGQDAGSVLDAKNAALALCDRLSRSRQERPRREGTEVAGRQGAYWEERTAHGGADVAGRQSPPWEEQTARGGAQTDGAENRSAPSDTGGQAEGAGAERGSHARLAERSAGSATGGADGADSPARRTEMPARRASCGSVLRTPEKDADWRHHRYAYGAGSASRTPEKDGLSREIFLPAIDPLPYVTAAVRNGPDERAPQEAGAGAAGRAAAPAGPAANAGTDAAGIARGSLSAGREPSAPERSKPGKSAPSPNRQASPPVDRLRPLVWPRGFEKLRSHFETGLPCALFDLPGWRFVRAGGADGLWIGIYAQDGRVRQVAYAHSGAAPRGENSLYRPARGLDGRAYQVLWQRV